ncbi:pyridoxamine 5'-phosphate oxidase family protein [soil metagenome]
MDFARVLSTEQELRELMGAPIAQAVVDKSITALDRHCRLFISRSPFVLISSSDADGRSDISPKGDPAGFVSVLDDHTLAIPDRPGNRRLDTLRNILQNPRVGLIFLIPGKRETLRVSGTARIVQDADLAASLSVAGKSPALCIVVDVEEAFFHCAKCIVRSKLWSHESWPPTDDLPSLAQAMIDAAKIPVPEHVVQAVIDQDERENLY